MTPLYLSHFALRRRRTSAPTKGAIMSFAIITDSTSDISPACAQELGIYVIPLHVVIEGEDLLDQVQITAEEYVARMAGSKQLPHTSQPSAGEFKALFDRVLADGHDSAIFISLCSEWSACYANACLVADTHELDVRCVDSRTGSGAEGLLVEYALAMRDDGRSLDETEAQIRAVDGVSDVNAPYEIINGFQTVQKVLNIAAMVIIVVLFVVSMFIISNTIKLAMYSRSQEIAIMKMVGATNSFIRLPFVVEGLILGFISSLVAFFLEWGLYDFLASKIAQIDTLQLITVVPFAECIEIVAIAYAITGFIVGVFGSMLSIRKFLKV